MKQLTVFEMETISGGYSWDFSSIQASITSLVSNGVEAVASAATMGTLAAVFGTFIGGTQAGANGGILGIGLIGNFVGLIAGFVGGAIMGAGCGLAWGWDGTMTVIEQGAQG
ncbi:hypothetical protein, partial [Klebsiella quasipneumoniae]